MKFFKRIITKINENSLSIFILFLILNLVPHFFVSISDSDYLLNWYPSDDSYYYFKTAQNIAYGKGITFDGINRTNGFHPLWMMICIPVFSLSGANLFLPLRVLVLIQAILNAGSGYFLYCFFSKKGEKRIGLITAFLWMFSFSIHEITTQLGMESGINAFSIVLLIYLISSSLSSPENSRKNPGNLLSISFASMLTLFSRLDNIFLVGIFGIWLVFIDNQVRWMALVDFVIILLSLTISFFTRLQYNENIFDFVPYFNFHLILSLALRPTFFYFLGLYEIKKDNFFQSLVRIFLSIFFSSGVMYLILFSMSNFLDIVSGFPRSVFFIDTLILFFLTIISRLAYFWFAKRVGYRQKAIQLREKFPEWAGRIANYFIPVVFVLFLYLLVNQLVFHSALPISGKIKHWWGTLPNTIYGRPINSLEGVFSTLISTNQEKGPFWLFWQPLNWIYKIFPDSFRNILFPKLISLMYVLLWVMVICIILRILFKGKSDKVQKTSPDVIFPLFITTVFHAFYYKTTGYLHTRYWYWISEMIFLVIFSASLVSFLFENIKFFIFHKKFLNLLSVIFSVFLFLDFSARVIGDYYFHKNTKPLYYIDEEIQFLNRHTQEGDIIGMTAAGLLGYFNEDRVIMNLDGLINSVEYFSEMKNGNAHIFLENLGLQYVYGNNYVLLNSDPYRWIFTDRLKFIEKGSSFTLYEYKLASP